MLRGTVETMQQPTPLPDNQVKFPCTEAGTQTEVENTVSQEVKEKRTVQGEVTLVQAEVMKEAKLRRRSRRSFSSTLFSNLQLCRR